MKLSETSKMKGTAYSWSLQAIETCPASAIQTVQEAKQWSLNIGDLVPACQNCYATKGFFNMPSVKAPRSENKQSWQKADFVPDMIKAISKKKRKHFRLFDSGDLYHLALAEKWYQIMVALPEIQFWLPTRMHKFAKFADVIERMQALPNVVVRFSSDSVNGGIIDGANTSTIIPSEMVLKEKSRDAIIATSDAYQICPATKPGNKPNCKANSCTACWDKSVKVIAYVEH